MCECRSLADPPTLSFSQGEEKEVDAAAAQNAVAGLQAVAAATRNEAAAR